MSYISGFIKLKFTAFIILQVLTSNSAWAVKPLTENELSNIVMQGVIIESTQNDAVVYQTSAAVIPVSLEHELVEHQVDSQITLTNENPVIPNEEALSQAGSINSIITSSHGDETFEELLNDAFTLLSEGYGIQAEMEITGLHYGDQKQSFLTEDGNINIPVPKQIDRISLNNISSGGGASVGNITMTNIQFHQGNLTIKTRP